MTPLSSYQAAYQTAFNQAQSGSAAVSVPFDADNYRAFGKRLLDVALVVLFAPTALLLIGLSALLLWCEGGSPFYRQARLGKGGATFSIFKLRTMVRDADQLLERHLAADPALRAEWDRTQKLKRDPRITRFGALLRKTSLDELPQLWNVLTGDMSLVGPRPMLPEQLPLYGDAVHYFALRPGITGYWQVSARNEGTFLSRVALDADYDHNLSLAEDIKVLLRTVGAVVNRTGY
ncbi:sugar transferase [Roseovarius sp. M141]|uniref:sugar transferase n=1 Tax=Roseovarius sp. M141 TaxID=2583806 RepID=UPI0020CC3FEC|nr:sugar transferase [Roseovarius sp. M141]MCQ0092943.1 sugar transferase [Roseovarius sp. M141]